MAKIYFNLIKADQWSIDNVPSRWRADVQALINQNAAEGVKWISMKERLKG